MALRAGQVVRFAGGTIIVAADATITHAVLHNRDGQGIVLLDPVIDARAHRNGVPGIELIDTVGARIKGGRLIRANLRLESYNNTRDLSIDVGGILIDMAGYMASAVYVGGVRGAAIYDLECSGGLEGIGIYNNACAIYFARVLSHGHRQDGFLINAGQQIAHVDCRAYGNGQSGFVTQRQAAGTDSRFASWTGCRAWDNDYDGFDIRGANIRPWNVDTGFVLTGCTARDNTQCGFYIVNAEGTVLKGCHAILNRRQNLFVDTSDRVIATDFRSTSGASAVPRGPNKAGILVYNSDAVVIERPVSGNRPTVHQDYGVAFTGTSRGGRVVGGDLANNIVQPVFAAPDTVTR
ncbi:MAG TPA: right-handed parallel beta-helix repeat-containing protein [Sphingomonas sp.]